MTRDHRAGPGDAATGCGEGGNDEPEFGEEEI
jgi:hypothetical protein